MAAVAETKREDLREKLETAIEQLVEVQVATVITQVEVELNATTGALEKVSVPTGKHDAIYTNLNLFSGDVTTVIAPALETNADLRTFHEGIVEKAVKVLPNNLSMLIDAFNKLFGKSGG